MSQLEVQGIHYATGKLTKFIIENGYIKDIIEIEENIANRPLVAPGLVDLQINGYKGTDFNKEPLTSEQWEAVVYDLAQAGVTTFYPTIITNSIDTLAYIFKENVEQLSKGDLYSTFIGGFHLEGPYISKEDGPRGAHFKEYVKHPEWDEFSRLQDIAKGLIKLITLSPEWEQSQAFIQKATNSGVKVAIGHTAATTAQIRSAVEAGAVLSTHLGNGAHLFMPRHPNYLWDQLAEEGLWSSVISDGHHLPVNVLKVIEKVKKEKMILISDSVSLAGMKPGHYKQAIGGEVTLTTDGRLHLKENEDLLAGSAQNLLQGIENLVNNHITDLKEAINKASIYPAKLMGLPQQQGLEIGAPADMILIEKNNCNLEIVKTYKRGQCIYRKEKGSIAFN